MKYLIIVKLSLLMVSVTDRLLVAIAITHGAYLANIVATRKQNFVKMRFWSSFLQCDLLSCIVTIAITAESAVTFISKGLFRAIWRPLPRFC